VMGFSIANLTLVILGLFLGAHVNRFPLFGETQRVRCGNKGFGPAD
jgi:hypothetical protein